MAPKIFLTVGLLIVMENLALILLDRSLRSVQTPYQVTALAVGPILFNAPYLAGLRGGVRGRADAVVGAEENLVGHGGASHRARPDGRPGCRASLPPRASVGARRA